MKLSNYLILILFYFFTGCSHNTDNDNLFYIVKLSDSKHYNKIEILITPQNQKIFLTNNYVNFNTLPINYKDTLLNKNIVDETINLTNREIETIQYDLKKISYKNKPAKYVLDGMSVVIIIITKEGYKKLQRLGNFDANDRKMITDLLNILKKKSANKWYFNRFLK